MVRIACGNPVDFPKVSNSSLLLLKCDLEEAHGTQMLRFLVSDSFKWAPPTDACHKKCQTDHDNGASRTRAGLGRENLLGPEYNTTVTKHKTELAVSRC